MIVPTTAANFRNMACIWKETGEIITLEEACRRMFDKIYDDPARQAAWAEIFGQRDAYAENDDEGPHGE